MNGVRGKMCTQAGHAYLHAFWDATIPNARHTTIAKPEVFAKKQEQAIAYANSGVGSHASCSGVGSHASCSGVGSHAQTIVGTHM